MRIETQFIKCVCFIGYRLADGDFRMAGSATFLTDAPDSMYVVTARHVINGIKGLGYDQVWLRVNLKDGSSQWVTSPLAKWFAHPEDKTVDVAVLHTQFVKDFDHLMLHTGWGLTDEKRQNKGVAVGDAVFITGMFRHHHGTNRNIPIARHGNIACMNEERVTTRVGEMDAYLIEVRSIGGLSGSPVFLHLGQAKTESDEVYNDIHLFGLIHGHFDVNEDSMDSIVEDSLGGKSPVHVNTGIAIVVPYSKISEVMLSYRSLNDPTETVALAWLQMVH